MKYFPAIIPDNDLYERASFKNGVKNGDSYEINSRKISPYQSKTNQSLISLVPELGGECDYALVPPQYCSGGKEQKVFLTAFRSSMLHPHRSFILDLKEFGWQDAFQQFYVEIKGSGYPDYTEIKQTDALDKESTSKKKIFSFDTLNLSFISVLDRPLGGQNEEFARSSLDYCRRLTEKKSRIKIAPVYEIVTLPDDVGQEILERDKSLNSQFLKLLVGANGRYDGYIAQEKRLMPSGLRAQNLGFASQQNKLFPLFSDLEGMVLNLLSDARAYSDNLFESTKKQGKHYVWERVGNVSHPSTQEFPELARDNALLSDLVIAPTGAYFVDLESLAMERTLPSDLKDFHRYYLGGVISVFSQLVGFFLTNIREIERRKYCSFPDSYLIWRESAKLVCLELGRSDFVQVNVGKQLIDFKVDYPRAKRKENFRFKLSDFVPLSRRYIRTINQQRHKSNK